MFLLVFVWLCVIPEGILLETGPLDDMDLFLEQHGLFIMKLSSTFFVLDVCLLWHDNTATCGNVIL